MVRTSASRLEPQVAGVLVAGIERPLVQPNPHMHRARRLVRMFVILVVGNMLVWAWALAEGQRQPVLLGAALLAYVFGLRHAFDADHIASIDNVTRSLARRGSAPATVGLWFSLGHSSVVIAACAAIALTIGQTHAWIARLAAWGGVSGTLFSVIFLCVVAGINIASIPAMAGALRRREVVTTDPPGPRGPLARLLGPLLRGVSRPWHMLAIGLLFGLGFDTASEIGLLGLSAETALHARSLWPIMSLALLFTAGMSLADATDGVIMARAYGWAFERPRRRLAYNIIITGISIAAALTVAAVELGNLARKQYALHGEAWNVVEWARDHSGLIGGLIVAALVGCWTAAWFGRNTTAQSRPSPGTNSME